MAVIGLYDQVAPSTWGPQVGEEKRWADDNVYARQIQEQMPQVRW